MYSRFCRFCAMARQVAASALAASLIIALVGPAYSQVVNPEQLLRQQQQGQLSNQNEAPLPSVQIQPAVPQVQAPLAQSRLEQILSARSGTRLEQFGYDQMGRGRAVTVPQTGAVQDDYVLGPGDQVIIFLRGQENNRFDITVDRNGQVTIPRLAPISASGRTFGSFREDLNAAIHRAYVATDASVSIGRVRQISVLVSGEVGQPGQLLLTGLSSAVDALLLAGGIKKTGSLRNIRIQRGGREYPVDLYNVLTQVGRGQSLRLADGDRILVPPLGATVAVAGLVRKPGIYELAPHTSAIGAKILQALAGGAEVRGRFRLSVLRTLPDGSSSLVPLLDGNGAVRDSEILFVQLGADQVTSQATLSGSTGLAGAYPVSGGTRLSEVLRAPGAMGQSPYTPFGIIVRRDPQSLMQSLVPFTPVAVLAGREDQTLQGGDVIRVLSTGEAALLTFVVQSYLTALAAQQTAIRNPLTTETGRTNEAEQISRQSGRPTEIGNIGSVPAYVQRNQIVGLLNVAAPGSPLAQRQEEQRKRDTERAARQSLLAQQQTPTSQQGPGQQGRQPTAMAGDTDQESASQDSDNLARNFTVQNNDPTRFATNSEVQTFGQLTRQLNIDPLVLINFLVDCRVQMDGAVRGPGYYFVGPGVSLADLVQAAGSTVNWADESGVELISTAVDRQSGRAMTSRTTLPLRQGTLGRYIVRPGDQLRFNQVDTDVGQGSVAVQGEVRFPGTFSMIRGEHLSDLLSRAGGLTNVAYPYGTVFLRQSAAQIEREGYNRAASEVQNQLVIAMTRVGNSKIDPATFASLQTFVTELRNQKALGRISIAADPSVLAAHPAQDPLLEPGDVVYVPQRPSTISVLGQVLQQGSYPYMAGESIGDYIARAGGYASTADESLTFVILPDGTARRVEHSWLSLSSNTLPPGSAIVVPRDVTPLDLRQTILDVSQILSQFAVSIASVAILSK